MFKVTGISRFKGQVKVRFANDMTRIKLLIKAGNTDIELIELPEPTDKAGCVRALLASTLYNVPSFAEAIDDAVEKYLHIAPKKAAKALATPKAVKVATPVAAAPNLDAIRARIVNAAVETVIAEVVAG